MSRTSRRLDELVLTPGILKSHSGDCRHPGIADTQTLLAPCPGIADTQTLLAPCSREPRREHSVIYSRSQRAASGCRLSARPTKARDRNLAFSTLLACFGGSQYGAIHRFAVTRPARGDASRPSNAAGSELRAAAARHQSASLDKSGLGRRPSLKPPSRATRRRPRQRTRATGSLLEHPAEFAHCLHPIRSIEPEPVEDRSQLGLPRTCSHGSPGRSNRAA